MAEPVWFGLLDEGFWHVESERCGFREEVIGGDDRGACVRVLFCVEMSKQGCFENRARGVPVRLSHFPVSHAWTEILSPLLCLFSPCSDFRTTRAPLGFSLVGMLISLSESHWCGVAWCVQGMVRREREAKGI